MFMTLDPHSVALLHESINVGTTLCRDMAEAQAVFLNKITELQGQMPSKTAFALVQFLKSENDRLREELSRAISEKDTV